MNRWNDNPAEDEMIGYLLGDLSDEQQTQFELRYLTDESLFTQMLLVKQDLIDGYVRHHLDAATRDKFERHFLATPEGQKEVAFAHALRERLNEPALATRTTTWSWERLRWFSSWSAREIGLAAAALLVVIVFGWLLMENQKLRQELARKQAERTDQSRREEELQQQIARLLALTPTPAPTVPVPERPAQSEELIAINLRAAARAGSDIQIVNLSAGTHHPRLSLRLDFEPIGLQCRVTLRTPDGVTIERNNVPARQRSQEGLFLQVDFPMLTLRAGNYEVTVTGRDADTNKELAIHYRFRVELSNHR